MPISCTIVVKSCVLVCTVMRNMLVMTRISSNTENGICLPLENTYFRLKLFERLGTNVSQKMIKEKCRVSKPLLPPYSN